jgi:hypothetical protein
VLSRPPRPVSEHDDIAGLEVRRGVLEEAEVFAGCVVEMVDGHRAPRTGRRRAETPRSTGSDVELGSDVLLRNAGMKGPATKPSWPGTPGAPALPRT